MSDKEFKSFNGFIDKWEFDANSDGKMSWINLWNTPPDRDNIEFYPVRVLPEELYQKMVKNLRDHDDDCLGWIGSKCTCGLSELLEKLEVSGE